MAITKQRLSKAEDLANPNKGNDTGFVVLLNLDDMYHYKQSKPTHSKRYILNLSGIAIDPEPEETAAPVQVHHVIHPVTHEISSNTGGEPASRVPEQLTKEDLEINNRIKAEVFAKINSNIEKYGLYSCYTPFKDVTAMQSAREAGNAYHELLQVKMQDAQTRSDHLKFVNKH